MDEIGFSKLAIGSVVPGTVPIISMDFHEKGELCVTTASDSSIVLVNALEGKVRKVVRSQKYGTGTIRYTHHDQVCKNVSILQSLCVAKIMRLTQRLTFVIHLQTERPSQQRQC
jgi:hypothetical protein